MIPIGVVSQQTGIGIDALRKWEHRYGFPQPVRSSKGQRLYSHEEVEQLKIVIRLIQSGSTTKIAIQQVIYSVEENNSRSNGNHEILDLLLENHIDGFYARLEQAYRKYTVEEFVNKIAIPLIGATGDAWQQGLLPVYAEHLFSQCLSEILSSNRPSASSLPREIKLILATPSQERHFLGIEMFTALLIDSGYQAIKLGPDLPNNEIIMAANRLNVSGVALSASVHYPPKLLISCLQDLRANLPAKKFIWVGGAGAQRVKGKVSGISIMNTFQEAFSLLKNLPQ